MKKQFNRDSLNISFGNIFFLPEFKKKVGPEPKQSVLM